MKRILNAILSLYDNIDDVYRDCCARFPCYEALKRAISINKCHDLVLARPNFEPIALIHRGVCVSVCVCVYVCVCMFTENIIKVNNNHNNDDNRAN